MKLRMALRAQGEDEGTMIMDLEPGDLVGMTDGYGRSMVVPVPLPESRQYSWKVAHEGLACWAYYIEGNVLYYEARDQGQTVRPGDIFSVLAPK